MNNELSTILKEYTSIEVTEAQSIAAQFAPQMEEVNRLSTVLPSLNRENPTTTDSLKARETRLMAVKNRTFAQKKKDELKRGLLDKTRLIDGLYGTVANSSKLLETELEKIEKYVEIQEKLRKEALRTRRSEELAKLEVDCTFYQLDEMSEESYLQLYTSSQISYDLKVAERKRIEDERIAQQKAEIEQRKKIEEENRVLKEKLEVQQKIDAENEKKAKAEKQRIEMEQKAKDDEIARLKAEVDARLLAENKRISDEKAKEEAEKLKKIEQEKEMLLAPDKEKIKNYFSKIMAVEKPMLTNANMSKKIDVFIKQVTSLITHF